MARWIATFRRDAKYASLIAPGSAGGLAQDYSMDDDPPAEPEAINAIGDVNIDNCD